MNTVFESGKQKMFWTSDTHFSHSNIIKYCSRPFENSDEMNQKLIDNWNSVVDDDAIVFHLGDVAFSSPEAAAEILKQLKGRKVLVIGNHDWTTLKEDKNDIFKSCFENVSPQIRIRIDGRVVYMNHFPFLTFDGMYNGMKCFWQLFGHVHSSKTQKTGLDISRLVNLFPNQYDVGVDNNNFTPISYDKLKTILNNQMLSLGLYRP